MPDRVRRMLEQRREVILYLLFGGLTTLISTGLFFLLRRVWPQQLTLGANIVSQAVSVLFAYGTNRKWVFRSEVRGARMLREMLSFFGARGLTILLDLALVFVAVDLLRLPEFWTKCAVVLLVIALNYVMSKFWIFLRRKP